MDSNSQEVVVPTYKQQNWGSYTLFYHNVYKTEYQPANFNNVTIHTLMSCKQKQRFPSHQKYYKILFFELFILVSDCVDFEFRIQLQNWFERLKQTKRELLDHLLPKIIITKDIFLT